MCYLKIVNTKSKASKFIYLNPYSLLDCVKILRFYKSRKDIEIQMIKIKGGAIKCRQITSI